MRRLVLFPEYRSSLTFGAKFGLALRGYDLLAEFVRNGDYDEICYFTYDGGDLQKLQEMERAGTATSHFSVLVPPRILSSRAGALVYSIVGPLIHYRTVAGAAMLRTHQVSGAWTALIAKLVSGAPLLFRLGYPLSIRFGTEGRRFRYLLARTVEWLLVRFADRVAVTSHAMRDYYSRMSPSAKIVILPNFVDTNSFTRIEDYDARKPILFVGRLEPVKNIHNLVIACGRLSLPLHIYGGGSLAAELQEFTRTQGAMVEFKGVVPNSELAQVHHQHTVYVLCSTREGMPKALIEAMASGLICISTPTDGARELIEDGRTGYLTQGFDADAIERKLAEVLAAIDPEVGRAAREFVRENNSMEHVVAVEHDIISELVRGRRRSLPQTGMQACRRILADPRPAIGFDSIPASSLVRSGRGKNFRAQQSEVIEMATTKPKSAEMMPGPGFMVRNHIERPPQYLIARFREFETPDISDMLNRMYTMSAKIHNLVNDEPLVGPACTVKVFPGDNLMVHKALDLAAPGDVVVIDTSGSRENAVLGDLVSTKAKHRGIAGFIIDGMVRDLPGMRRAGLPVYARGVTPFGPLHRGPGELNYTISCGGIVVNPGDIIAADTNGVVVVRKEFAEDVMTRLQQNRERMAEYIAAVGRGEFSNEWVDDQLGRDGCVFNS